MMPRPRNAIRGDFMASPRTLAADFANVADKTARTKLTALTCGLAGQRACARPHCLGRPHASALPYHATRLSGSSLTESRAQKKHATGKPGGVFEKRNSKPRPSGSAYAF